MPARTRGRAKFDFNGRPFVWWVDGDLWLRVASLDKRFVIARPMGTLLGEPPTILVVGSEFLGLEPTEVRPIRLIVPEEPAGTRGMGGTVEHLLRWSFNPRHELLRYDRPVLFA